MMVETRKLDLASSNLFFAQIPGFKAASQIRAALAPTPASIPTDVQTTLAGQFVDPSPGPLRPTGKPLDLALEQEGFFAVQTRSGVAYTRDGRFHKNSGGVLSDGMGNPVLGEDGPIRIPTDDLSETPVAVTPDGKIVAGGKPLGRLLIQNFPGARGLQAGGGSLFFATGATAPQPSDARVIQGALEDANTSGVAEMSKTIETVRAFESYQKVLQTIDETTGEAVQRIGRLA
jgi:flagellar basal body rod protein FlgG